MDVERIRESVRNEVGIGYNADIISEALICKCSDCFLFTDEQKRVFDLMRDKFKIKRKAVKEDYYYKIVRQ